MAITVTGMKRVLVVVAVAAIPLAGCSSNSSSSPSQSPDPTISASQWTPINGYTEADYQKYIDQMNQQLAASSASMSPETKAAFPQIVSCAWDRITNEIPADYARQFNDDPTSADGSQAGQEAQQIWQDCNLKIASELAKSASPSAS